MANKHKNTTRQLTQFDKRVREGEVRDRVRLVGGTLLRFNWKKNKRKAHFLTATGNKGITHF